MPLHIYDKYLSGQYILVYKKNDQWYLNYDSSDSICFDLFLKVDNVSLCTRRMANDSDLGPGFFRFCLFCFIPKS